jgi:hypothetical protein
VVCGLFAAAGIVLVAAHTRAEGVSVVARTGYRVPTPIARPEILPLAISGSKLAGALFTGPAPAQPTCPSDMVEVEGEYCPYVEQRCLRWIETKSPATRCAEFAPSAPCRMKTTKKTFCIDRYEWPNRAGAIPEYMTSWKEARAACNAAGKRLCTDSEWTLACEGPQHLPYPYGLKRDSNACNIDKPHDFPNPAKVYDPKTQSAELARLDRREPSGSRAACTSPFGAHDMAGNVDEWVVNETGDGFQSGLKGGYWGPVKNRCRPMTVAHEETFRYYQIGFRCCA